MAGVTAAIGADLPVGRDDEGVGWPSELLPALMAETAAMGRPGRLRRSGVLIRAALRDR